MMLSPSDICSVLHINKTKFYSVGPRSDPFWIFYRDRGKDDGKTVDRPQVFAAFLETLDEVNGLRLFPAFGNLATDSWTMPPP